MEIVVDFPGGDRVDAHFGPFTVKTDQNGSAPSPFATFLASIGTCAGIYVLGFIKQRGLSTEGVRIVQRHYQNPMTGMIEKIDMEIQVPSSFPDRYYPALVRTAELCAVKKHLMNPPAFNVYAQAVSEAGV